MQKSAPYQTSRKRLFGGPTDHRNFRIVSMELDKIGQPVDAACQFMYRGHYVSVTTAGLSQGACQSKILISKLDNNMGTQDSAITVTDVSEVNTIEEAINCINMLVGDPSDLKLSHC